MIFLRGAVGKMNLTCSNLPRARKFLPRPILASWHQHRQRCWLGGLATYHPAPVSPRPCTKMTVAVCFLVAGTMRAAGLLAMVLWRPNAA